MSPPEYADHSTSNPLDPSTFIPSSSGIPGYAPPPIASGSDAAGRQSLCAGIESFHGRQSLGGVDPSLTSRQPIGPGIETRSSLGSIESLGVGRQSLGGVDPTLTSRQSIGSIDQMAGRQSLGGMEPSLAGRQLDDGGVGGVEGYRPEAVPRHTSNMHAPGEDEGRALGDVQT